MSKRKRSDQPDMDGDAPEGDEAAHTAQHAPDQSQTAEAEARQAAQAVQLSQLKFTKPLSGITDLPRNLCANCGKKRKYYCYNCIRPVWPEHHKCDLQLPLKLYIYKHFNEKNSRSTAIHAAIISPDVQVCEYPDLGPDLDPSETLVLYPSPEAVPLSEVKDLHRYKNAVVIEATWQQSRCISLEPKVLEYKRVRLDQHRSIFWRYQSKDDTYLATIEAIYFFYVEYRNAILAAQGSTEKYDGEYDDLLFFYSHIYQTIQNAYKADRSLEFTPRARPGYIHYDEEDPLLKDATEATAVARPQVRSAAETAATPDLDVGSMATSSTSDPTQDTSASEPAKL